jgi:uncharacterized protein
MNKEIIDRALEFVKESFANEFSGHDYFHTLRVFNLATRIAEEEGADIETVQLVALLHDVDDHKLSPDTSESKANARRFLKENGIDEKKIDEICTMIGDISFAGSDSVTPTTIEGKCAQDADRLDAIGAIGIARAFAYGGSHQRLMYDPEQKPIMDMGREEYYNRKSTTVNHFYEKLFKLKDMMNTRSARRIADERNEYMQQYIDRFMSEWNGRS